MPYRPDDRRLIVWGRCRSGNRWFWVATDFGDDQLRHVYGRTDTEVDALTATRVAFDEIAQGEPFRPRPSHGHARSVLKQLNAEKRRARPATDTTDTAPVEYLWGTQWDSEDRRYRLERFPITKKTAKRIYYRRPREDSIGFVDRVELEAKGEVDNRGRSWYAADSHLYSQPPELERPAPTPVDQQAELSRLRAEAAEAHPDRGGSNEAFRVAHGRYTKAKIRTRRQHQEAS